MAGAGAPGERIAKRLARAGLCSRRQAERWIAEGRVEVDGRRLASAAHVVGEGSVITVDGRPLPAAGPARLWRYHKPRGLITSHRDPEARPTVFEHLPDELPRVISVGRLDLDSEGLLLLTTDGDLAAKLQSPRTGWRRCYRARVYGVLDEARLAYLAQGLSIEGVEYGPIEATLERRLGRNAWLVVSLREGRNREVRRALAHLGLAVNRLIRTAYGPFELGRLRPGRLAEVAPETLAEQIGGDGTRGAAAHAHRRR